MIYFDITKTAAVRHRSGLARMSERLREELGDAACAVSWKECSARAHADDWFITSELFAEGERPGFTDFLQARRCRTAAIFADAIPLKHPHITWPQSVARHPHYLKLLAGFDRVWAISRASRDELCDYWHWLGLERTPSVEVLPLGADLARTPRVTGPGSGPRTRALLCVGILEPRKNQLLLLEAAEELWRQGLELDVHLVGRVNPHFGAPVVARIKALRQAGRAVHYHAAASDPELSRLFAMARATVFPTIAEGCGLPLLESLWQGVPCVCSDLPVLRENAAGGGCWPVPTGDRTAWANALRKILTEDELCRRLATEARERPLPTWREAAERLRAGLK